MTETKLPVLLREARPQLHSGSYVFVALTTGHTVPAKDVLMSFREAEGLTLILEKSVADQYALAYAYEAAWITMTVNSALEAVGFTAAFATALSAEEISCNVVAAFHHDHLFVAREDGERALRILSGLG
jgi:hypothetical protein